MFTYVLTNYFTKQFQLNFQPICFFLVSAQFIDIRKINLCPKSISASK